MTYLTFVAIIGIIFNVGLIYPSYAEDKWFWRSLIEDERSKKTYECPRKGDLTTSCECVKRARTTRGLPPTPKYLCQLNNYLVADGSVIVEVAIHPNIRVGSSSLSGSLFDADEFTDALYYVLRKRRERERQDALKNKISSGQSYAIDLERNAWKLATAPPELHDDRGDDETNGDTFSIWDVLTPWKRRNKQNIQREIAKTNIEEVFVYRQKPLPVVAKEFFPEHSLDDDTPTDSTTPKQSASVSPALSKDGVRILNKAESQAETSEISSVSIESGHVMQLEVVAFQSCRGDENKPRKSRFEEGDTCQSPDEVEVIPCGILAKMIGQVVTDVTFFINQLANERLRNMDPGKSHGYMTVFEILSIDVKGKYLLERVHYRIKKGVKLSVKDLAQRRLSEEDTIRYTQSLSTLPAWILASGTSIGVFVVCCAVCTVAKSFNFGRTDGEDAEFDNEAERDRAIRRKKSKRDTSNGVGMKPSTSDYNKRLSHAVIKLKNSNRTALSSANDEEHPMRPGDIDRVEVVGAESLPTSDQTRRHCEHRGSRRRWRRATRKLINTMAAAEIFRSGATSQRSRSNGPRRRRKRRSRTNSSFDDDDYDDKQFETRLQELSRIRNRLREVEDRTGIEYSGNMSSAGDNLFEEPSPVAGRRPSQLPPFEFEFQDRIVEISTPTDIESPQIPACHDYGQSTLFFPSEKKSSLPRRTDRDAESI